MRFEKERIFHCEREGDVKVDDSTSYRTAFRSRRTMFVATNMIVSMLAMS
ncbi:MAG TPA: hypothetical protein VLD37_04345 [Candidatus Bilamarchaeum sp.]|nr:hypothetical protein [Candidatus Bilamarchaeum sp.]